MVTVEFYDVSLTYFNVMSLCILKKKIVSTGSVGTYEKKFFFGIIRKKLNFTKYLLDHYISVPLINKRRRYETKLLFLNASISY